MGTPAMGLAGGIGGFGNAAMEYGKQIRGILEQRREGLANFISQQALQADEPQRSELLQHAADLFAGKDMSKVAPALFKTVQAHAASDAALGQFGQQLTGRGGTPPAPTPGPAGPGQTPGAPPAAQPSTSLVDLRQRSFAVSPNDTSQSPLASPQSQTQGSQAISQPPTVGVGGAIPQVEATPRILPPPPQPVAPATPTAAPAPTGNIPSVMGAPGLNDPLANVQQEVEGIIHKYDAMYASAAPVRRPMIQAEFNAEMARIAPFLQKKMQMDNLTGYQDALYKLQGDKQFQALPFMAQIQHLSNLSQAYGFQPSSLPYGYMGAANRIETKPEDAAALEQKYPGILAKYRIDPNKTPVVNVSRNPMMQMQGMDMPVNVEGVYPGTVTAQTAGGVEVAPKLPGQVAGAVPPAYNRPFVANTPQGPVSETPAELRAGVKGAPTGGLLPPGYFGSTPAVGGGVEQYNKANPTAAPVHIPGSVASATYQKPPQAIIINPQDNRAELIRPGGTVPPGAQTISGVNAVNTPTSQMRNVAAQAGIAHEGAPALLSELDTMKDELGPFMGRWDMFMQGAVGMDNPRFAGLRADLLMYSSAVALMHARGRLPENLRREFDDAINSPKQTVDNLKTVIKHIDDWTVRSQQTTGGFNTGNRTAPGSLTPSPGTVRKYNPTTGKLE